MNERAYKTRDSLRYMYTQNDDDREQIILQSSSMWFLRAEIITYTKRVNKNHISTNVQHQPHVLFVPASPFPHDMNNATIKSRTLFVRQTNVHDNEIHFGCPTGLRDVNHYMFTIYIFCTARSSSGFLEISRQPLFRPEASGGARFTAKWESHHNIHQIIRPLSSFSDLWIIHESMPRARN